MGVGHTDKFSFREIGENASIHGVRQLSLTYHHSKFVLVGWICIICVAFVTICYQITTLINLVLTYPSSVAISVSLEHTIFPTVTACNMGVYKKSVVETIDTFVQMSQTLSNVSSLQRSKREAARDEQINNAGDKTRQKRQTPICATACNASGEFCYISYTSVKSNGGAQTTCATDGGKLPFFSTLAQYNRYYAYQQSIFSNATKFWLGFWNYSPHNISVPGIWQDTNGTGSVLSFSNWCPSEPGDGGNANLEKCVTSAAPPGCWGDLQCSSVNPFICMCQCPIISIANGSVVINSQVPTINYTAQFQCDVGYQLVGSPTLYCINSGGGMNWDQTAPSCIPITTTTTTTTTPTITTTTTTASPNCSTCAISGEFCYIQYTIATTNANAQSTCAIAGGKLPFFSTMAQYDSYYAYQVSLVGSAWVWLGFWNYSPHNATSPGTWQDANGTGSVLNFSKWYSMEPNDMNSDEKCAANGAPGWWYDCPCSSGPMPTAFFCMCQCPVISIANGTVVTSPVPTINYTAQIQCNSGYQLVGSTTLTCIFNSGGGVSWDQAVPTCVPITTTTTTTTSTTPTTTASTTTTTTTEMTTPTTILMTSTIPTTSTITTTFIKPTTVETVTIEVASLIPNVSTAEFTASLELTTTAKNGTVDNIAAATQLTAAMEVVLSSLPQAELKQLGFQRNEFVTACLFSGIPCNNDEKLKLVQIPEFMNCYAFNHRDQTNLYTFERPGEKFGLSMAFNIQADEYINTVAIAGVQLFLQEQFDPILPGSMGSIYSPGLMYYIIISKRIESQVSVPNRLCLSSTKENSFNIFKNDTYFTESCLRSYLQVKIISNCGCGSAKYPLPNDNSQFCNLTTAKCATNYLTSFGAKLSEEAQVACPPACRSVSFDLTTTFASLSPEQSLLDHLNVTRTTYMKNVVMVKLFFTTGTIMVYTEALNFDVMSVLSNIGGSVGCIAGLSMISLVELFFVIAKVVKLVKYKCHNRQLQFSNVSEFK